MSFQVNTVDIYHRGFWILIPCVIGGYRRIGTWLLDFRVKVLGPYLRLKYMQLVPSACAVKTQQITGDSKCVL
jgi:hypothetical protein